MKILHAIEHLNIGGEEILLCDLVRTLNRPEYAHIHQHVAVLKGGVLLDQLRQDNIPVSDFAGTGYWRRLRGLQMLLREFKPDIIHTRLSSAGYWLRTAALLSRTDTLFIHAHGGQTFYPASIKRRVLEKIFDVFTTKHICVSESIKQHLLRHGFHENKLVTILNGVSTDRISPRSRRSFSNPPRLVCVGRLERIKGQDILLESLAAIQAKSLDFHCDFIGDGSQRQALETDAARLGIADCVSFLGNQPDASSRLNEYDVFIQPSRSEGLSLALIEAMIAGLPIVATDVGENRRVLSGHGNIALPENSNSLAETLGGVLECPDAALLKAREATALARPYTVENMSQHYVQLFSQCYAGKENGGRV